MAVTVPGGWMTVVEDFIAIINPLKTAILPVCSAKEVTVAVKSGLAHESHYLCYHRVNDRAETAQPKVQALAGFLENPVRMLV